MTAVSNLWPLLPRHPCVTNNTAEYVMFAPPTPGSNGCSDSLVPHSTAHLPTSVDVVCRKLNTWRCFAVSGFQSVSFRLSHNRSMSFQFSQKLLGSGLSWRSGEQVFFLLVDFDVLVQERVSSLKIYFTGTVQPRKKTGSRRGPRCFAQTNNRPDWLWIMSAGTQKPIGWSLQRGRLQR